MGLPDIRTCRVMGKNFSELDSGFRGVPEWNINDALSVPDSCANEGSVLEILKRRPSIRTCSAVKIFFSILLGESVVLSICKPSIGWMSNVHSSVRSSVLLALTKTPKYSTWLEIKLNVIEMHARRTDARNNKKVFTSSIAKYCVTRWVIEGSHINLRTLTFENKEKK